MKAFTKISCRLNFCDIQMPAMTGINLAKLLQQNTMVIFTTAFSEYGVVSYELNAIDYLLKPINQKRFTQAIAKAQEYFDYIGKKEQSGDKSIFYSCRFQFGKNSFS
ncbi:MAG: response regulator [Bacteroidia bacterium]|nr:response regulator [Bacteroidia bacterium]